MDEARTRERVKQHAAAVERGDMDAVVVDFSESMRPQVPQLAQALAQPVTSAEVLSVEIGDRESVAMICYRGDSGEVTVRSRALAGGGRAPPHRLRRARRVNHRPARLPARAGARV